DLPGLDAGEVDVPGGARNRRRGQGQWTAAGPMVVPARLRGQQAGRDGARRGRVRSANRGATRREYDQGQAAHRFYRTGRGKKSVRRQQGSARAVLRAHQARHPVGLRRPAHRDFLGRRQGDRRLAAEHRPRHPRRRRFRLDHRPQQLSASEARSDRAARQGHRHLQKLTEHSAAYSGATEKVKYSEYQHLLFEQIDDAVLLITINRPEVLNATNSRLHWELSRVWLDVADDDETNVVVVTGAGRAFSAGGDLDMIAQMTANAANVGKAWKEAGDIVYNMINLDKPIISAINGVAVGAGLAVAFMADIRIASEAMRITDGHLRLGVAAGDHAVIIWPLLCGMAKAKYYLMTAEFIDGKEAERIGLVSLCVPADQLMDKAFEVARKLARGPQQAVRFTKRSLNNWLRVAGPAFDASLALEMMGFFGADLTEGVAALQEKRQPSFPGFAKPKR